MLYKYKIVDISLTAAKNGLYNEGYHQSVILRLFQIQNKIVTTSKAYYSNAKTGRKVSDRRGLPWQVSRSNSLMTKFIIFRGKCVFTMPGCLPSKSAVNYHHFVYFKM